MWDAAGEGCICWDGMQWPANQHSSSCRPLLSSPTLHRPSRVTRRVSRVLHSRQRRTPQHHPRVGRLSRRCGRWVGGKKYKHSSGVGPGAAQLVVSVHGRMLPPLLLLLHHGTAAACSSGACARRHSRPACPLNRQGGAWSVSSTHAPSCSTHTHTLSLSCLSSTHRWQGAGQRPRPECACCRPQRRAAAGQRRVRLQRSKPRQASIQALVTLASLCLPPARFLLHASRRRRQAGCVLHWGPHTLSLFPPCFPPSSTVRLTPFLSLPHVSPLLHPLQ